MILLVAIIIGLTAGFIRAGIAKRSYQPFDLKFIWLVLIALLAQWLVFYVAPTRNFIPDSLASIILVLSQFLLLFFAWENRKVPGFWLLGAGLLLNLTVILFNGGLMPISPEMVRWLAPDAPEGSWHIGARLAYGKDRILLVETTRLWILSDHLRLPDDFPYRFAFSFGDVLIAFGAFWVFWSMGGAVKNNDLRRLHNDTKTF